MCDLEVESQECRILRLSYKNVVLRPLCGLKIESRECLVLGLGRTCEPRLSRKNVSQVNPASTSF